MFHDAVECSSHTDCGADGPLAIIKPRKVTETKLLKGIRLLQRPLIVLPTVRTGDVEAGKLLSFALLQCPFSRAYTCIHVYMLPTHGGGNGDMMTGLHR